MWTSVSTIGDLLDRQAEANDGTALVMPGTRLSYRELSAASDRFAASLAGLGVGAGDKVGILMPNTADFVLALLAVAKLGAISVPINGRFKSAEASYVIGHADVKVMLTSADPNGTDYPALISQVIGGQGASTGALAGLRHVVAFSESDHGFLTREQFEAAGASVPVSAIKTAQSRVRVRDVALLMYTSGTTARPKGCLLTHEALTRQGEKVARTRFMLTEQDGFWDPLPLYHCGGIVPMLGCFSVGAKYCHAGFFRADEAIETIQRERCTVLYPSFEAIWLPIISHPSFRDSDFSHVRLVQNIATPERMAQFEREMPWARQVTSYGSTECATNLTLGHPDDPLEVRTRTLGRPVEGMEVKIVDPDTGKEVGPGIMGELCFRGYSCFEGYYKDPELTAASFDSEGYFHTGDRASIDADGNMLYGGRLKDMLKVGGENLAAIEVEDYLSRHPGVGIVQVVSAPDARYGEVPAAFVERAAGSQVTEQELIDFCIGSIATFKVPRYVRFVTQWPMSGTKVQKFVLRDQLAGELKEAGITEAPKVSSRR